MRRARGTYNKQSGRRSCSRRRHQARRLSRGWQRRGTEREGGTIILNCLNRGLGEEKENEWNRQKMETGRLADEEIGCGAVFLLNGVINNSWLAEFQNRTDHESGKRESGH